MTEQQIRDGYERMDSALAPPLDAQERVANRVKVRRQRRRVAVAGATALGVVAVGGAVVALISGDDTNRQVAVDPPSGVTSTLELTRPDGSTYAFDEMRVTCDPPYEDESFSGVQRIWAVSPRHIENERVTKPMVYFQGIVSKIEGDKTFTFPNDWSMSSEEEPMILFAADSEGAPRGNEASTSQAGAAGTVRVVHASCDPMPTLHLEVDTDLGSEVSQPTLHIAGELR